MPLHAEDYVGRTGDSRVLNALSEELKGESEEDRFQFILDMLSLPGGAWAAIQLANRCLQDRSFLEAIFLEGIEQRMDASLDYLLPRLGYRRVIAILKSKLEQDRRSAKTISLALYYMGQPPNDTRLIEATESLAAEVDLILKGGNSKVES